MTIDEAIRILRALKKEHGGETLLMMGNPTTQVPYAVTDVRFMDPRHMKKLTANEAVPKLWHSLDDPRSKGRAIIWVHN